MRVTGSIRIVLLLAAVLASASSTLGSESGFLVVSSGLRPSSNSVSTKKIVSAEGGTAGNEDIHRHNFVHGRTRASNLGTTSVGTPEPMLTFSQ
jgi:hypothetical protein